MKLFEKKFLEKLPTKWCLPTWTLHCYLHVVVHLRTAKLVYVTARTEEMDRLTSVVCALYQLLTNNIIQVSINFKNKD